MKNSQKTEIQVLKGQVLRAERKAKAQIKASGLSGGETILREWRKELVEEMASNLPDLAAFIAGASPELAARVVSGDLKLVDLFRLAQAGMQQGRQGV